MKVGKAVAALAVLGGLAVPATASVATETWGGSGDGGTLIAIDAKVSGKGFIKQITELRAEQIPITCDISGGPQRAGTIFPVKLKVNSKGKFGAEVTDDQGNRQSINGRFSKNGRKITGSFVYADHFAAQGSLPEENCHSEQLAFSVKLGGPDIDGINSTPES